MTLKEAKKILKKEGYFLTKVSSKFKFPELPVWEKQEVIEAKKIVNDHCFAIVMSGKEWFDRQERLKKEHEENTKASGSDGDQPKEGNPALKESASQFNNALLDEQAKKIEKLTEENERLEDKITIFNIFKKRNDEAYRRQIRSLDKDISKLKGIIHDKNMKIEELRKESSRHLRGKIKIFGENADLEKMLKDKDAVLSDVAEELRLSKIREKNLTEVCQKYMKENEDLKKKLANKNVDKIDAHTLKSAESALAYKEKVIAEKDEVIADLDKELKAKHKKYVWYKGLYEAAKQILNTIADYASKHPDKKFSDQMVGVDIAEEGADLTGVIIIKSEK